MGVYLDECYLGIDTEINYPHLLLCVGVTCQFEDGTLIGVHIDSGGEVERANLAELKRLIGNHRSNPVNLYMIGNRSENAKNMGRSWFEKAHALGFTGRIWIHDTTEIWTNAGVFARIKSRPEDPKGMCEIRVCNEQQVQYTTQAYSPALNVQVIEGQTKNGKMVYGAPRFVKTALKPGTQLPAPLLKSDFKFISI